MQIKVDAKSKFGVKDAITGTWLNPSDKKLLLTFVVGNTYDVELVANKGKDGKVYLNIQTAKLIAGGSTTPVVTTGKTFKPNAFSPIDNRDQRILIQGLTQAVLQSPVMELVKLEDVTNITEQIVVKLAEMVKRLAK